MSAPLGNSSVGHSREKYNSSNSGGTRSGSVDKSRMDTQVMVSNGSVMGTLSNSSVSLLNKKDGHSREIYNLSNSGSTGGYSGGDKSRTGTFNEKVEHSRENNGSSNLMNRTRSAESADSDKTKDSIDKKNKMVNASLNGEGMTDRRKKNLWAKMSGCDFFDGNWVKDNWYPLYKAGSCPHIDEPFDCFRNGRPDNGYEKFRWQPKGCNIPRLIGRDMLEMLRGKRLVYVGDSLNRNMWESMVCTLRNAVKDKRKVFEASGRQEFRTEGSYSFVFTDYNCSVEFFRSTFLVREWDMPDANGLKRETLRLDLVEGSYDRFKTADILVFNTGHWWTHEKTSQGKGYYQEGGHVYDELHVIEAFRKAMTTWGRWIDANINPKKTLVFFRGYSASHFSGGQWNSGGQCDSETVPIINETYLSGYPEIMSMLERVMRGMKTPILYLNVTKMTDFRKDAHPSIYRSQHLTEEERRSPLRFQDCSHWCLPGVPETWNELLYALIFTKYKQKQQQIEKQLQRTRH